MTDTSKFFAALIASLIVVSSLGGVAIAPADAQTGTDGMLALGNAQVSEDLPADADVPIRASDLEGAVYASDHADTLEVVLTTPERAEEYMSANASVLADDEIAIVLRDDEVSDGRDVAIDLEVLETGVGFVPEVAYGTHEDGERWESAIEREGTVGRFNVPHFSENAVTFTGGVSINATPATDGSTFEYELSDLDSASNVTVNLTGELNTEAESTQYTTTGTKSIAVSGNVAPKNETVKASAVANETIDTGVDARADLAGADLDNDGTDEIAIRTQNQNLLTHDPDDGSNTTTGVSDLYKVSGGDVDGDGVDEVALIDGNFNLRYYDDGSTTDTGKQAYALTTADTDDDGTDEIAYERESDSNLIIYDHVDGTTTDSGQGTSKLTTGDTDGDGADEIPYQPSSGGISIYDPADDTNTDTGESFSNGIGSGDVDGDGTDEVAFRGSASSDPLLVYDPDDGSTTDTGESATVISVGDVDGDGAGEIPFRDADTGDLGIHDFTDGTTRTTPEPSNGLVTPDTNGDGLSEVVGDGSTVLIRVPGGPATVSVDIGNDGTTDATVDAPVSGTNSASVDLSLSTDTVAISADNRIETVSLSFSERTETTDPTIQLNSESVSHPETLADGETTSLSIPASELQTGTNRVNVSVGDGTLSSDAPPAAVGLELSHDASDEQTVDYGAETWSERYNISRTYGDATENPTLTIPFEGEVVDINSVDVRRNGSSWGPPAAWTLDNTTLTIEFDPVDAGETLEVRAIGRKVRTVNGDIEVLEPTVEGDSLNSKIEITDRSEEFAIDVSGSDRIHYTAEESWSASSHAVVESGGGQELRLPEASVGSQTRVRTAPINVVPESGASEVVIEDVDEPRFQISEGNTTGASNVDVTYYDTLSGERYVLWSESQEREIDADRAESPVAFRTDGDADTYTIRQMAAPDSGVGGAPVESRDVGAPLVLVVPAVGISVTGLFWAGRRFGGARGIRGNALLLVGSTVVAIAAVELVAPGTISSIVSTFVFALSDSVAGGLGAAVAAVAVFVGLWQLQQRTSADIPWWVIGPAMGIAAVAALEAIRPGSVLGALEVVLSEYGGLVVLGGLALVGYVIYQRRQTQQAEASTPDTAVDFEIDANSED